MGWRWIVGVCGATAALFATTSACSSGGSGLAFSRPVKLVQHPTDDDRWYVVEQARQEEIDLVVLGGNYGWDCREGELDFEPEPSCDTAGFIAPESVHDRTDARSITGGVVYRGAAIPELAGYYVYGDFLTDRIFAFDTSVADAPVIRLDVDSSVSAFGQGRDGAVYLVGFGMPSIQKLVRAGG